jgi:hypothetical protein
MAILLLIPGTHLLPVTHPITRFIERLILDSPIITALVLNLLALLPWFTFLFHKKIKKKKLLGNRLRD